MGNRNIPKANEGEPKGGPDAVGSDKTVVPPLQLSLASLIPPAKLSTTEAQVLPGSSPKVRERSAVEPERIAKLESPRRRESLAEPGAKVAKLEPGRNVRAAEAQLHKGSLTVHRKPIEHTRPKKDSKPEVTKAKKEGGEGAVKRKVEAKDAGKDERKREAAIKQREDAKKKCNRSGTEKCQ